MGWSDAWVSVDTETTGFGQEARVVEIGVTRFEHGQPVFTWSTLLYPPNVDWESEKVKGAMAVNGLSRDELVGKPLFAQVYDELCDVMHCPVWVAHNAEFDLRMLVQECNRLGKQTLMQLPQVAFCTKTLAYQLEPDLPNHKLETIAKRWRVTQEHAHRALDDAKVCGMVLSEMYGDAILPDDDTQMLNLFYASQASWNRRGRKAQGY
jgi:DNA polymerase III subunit epsilon